MIKVFFIDNLYACLAQHPSIRAAQHPEVDTQ